MKKNFLSVSSNPFRQKKILFPQNYKYAKLYENFLDKNLEDNKKLKLGKEINKKKHEISSMFRKKFGRDFLNVKPDSLIIFQKQFGQFLFDPDSQFLSNFPKLQRKLRHERKISEFKLKEKIDMGAMIFYDLKAKSKKQVRHLSMAKEKLLAISKNLKSGPNKDLIQAGINKTKFLDKNRINSPKYFKNHLLDNLIKEEYEENSIENNNNNSEYQSSEDQKEGESGDKSSVNNSIIKDFKQKEVMNKKFENEKIKKKNSILNNNKKKGSVVSDIREKYKDNPINQKEIKNNNNITKTSKYGNVIPNLINNKNKSRNNNNFSSLFGNSTTFKNYTNNISPSKINESNNTTSYFLNTVTNFNLSNSKGYSQRLTTYKNNIHNKYRKKKILVPSLKKKHYKFKFNLDNHITKLNQYTNKCNTELIKLIDINNDDNYTERKKKYLNRNKLDIKGILIEKKDIKKSESDSETDEEENEKGNQTEKPKEGEKDSVKILLEGARNDLKDKFGGKLEAHNKEKMFKKNIIHISDEQALGMAEDFVEKEKELDIRKVLETDSRLQMKRQRQIISIRLKTKKNYDQMIRLKNQIMIDKGKIFKELEKYDIN